MAQTVWIFLFLRPPLLKQDAHVKVVSPGIWCVFSAVVVMAFPAAAEPQTHAVVDAIAVGPSECFAGPDLASRVEMWLGRSEIDQRVSVQVSDLRHRGEGVVFVVTREGKPAAERRLRPREIPCADLTAAVGLAVAMAIDATFLASFLDVEDLRRTEEPPSPTPPPPLPSPVADEPAPKPVRAEPKREASFVHGALQATGLIGVLPVPTAGGTFSVDVSLSRGLELRLAGLGTFDPAVQLGSGRVRVGAAAARVSPCLVQPIDELSVAGCAGLVAGRWVARGEEFDVNHASTLPWAAVVATGEGRLRLGELTSLRFTVEGFVPFVRPSLDVEDGSGRVVASKQAATAGLGISVGPAIAFF